MLLEEMDLQLQHHYKELLLLIVDMEVKTLDMLEVLELSV
jgi:hypothetical protein